MPVLIGPGGVFNPRHAILLGTTAYTPPPPPPPTTGAMSFGPAAVLTAPSYVDAGNFGLALSRGNAKVTLPTLVGDWTMTFGYTAPVGDGQYHGIVGIAGTPNNNHFLTVAPSGALFFGNSTDYSTPTICGIGRQEIRITHTAAGNVNALYVNGAVHGAVGSFTLPASPAITLSAAGDTTFDVSGFGAFDCFEVCSIVRNIGAYTPSASQPVVDTYTVAYVQFLDYMAPLIIAAIPASPSFRQGAQNTIAALTPVPVGYARAISGDGRVVLSDSKNALVIGTTAATAGTSVPVTITDTRTGRPAVTLALTIPVMAPATSTLGVSLRLTNARPAASVIAPLTTIGHAFARGDVPSGFRVKVMAGGAAVPVQQDQEALWPDGSLKFAALSLKPVETFGPWTGGTVGGDTQVYTVTADSAPPNRAPLFTLAQFVAANDIKVEFDSFDCGTDLLTCSLNDIVANFCATPWEGGPLPLTAAAAAGATVLQVADARHITKGQLVTGTGTATKTLVTGVSGGSVTIAPALVSAVTSGTFLTFNSPLGGWEMIRSGQVCMEWRGFSYLRVKGGARDGQYHTEVRCMLYVRSWGLAGPHEVYAHIENPNIHGHIPGGMYGPTDESMRKRFVCNARVMNGTRVLMYFGGVNDSRKFVLPNTAIDVTTGLITWPTGVNTDGYGVTLTSSGTLPGDMLPNTAAWISGGNLLTSRLLVGRGVSAWVANTAFDSYPNFVQANQAVFWKGYNVPGTTAATGSGPIGIAPLDGTVQWTRISAGRLNTQGSGTLTVLPTLTCFAGGSSAFLADRNAEPIWDAGTSGIAARPHMLPSYQKDYLTTKTKMVLPFDLAIQTYPRTSGVLVDRGVTGVFEDYQPGQVQPFGWKISQYGDDPGDERVGYFNSSSALLVLQQADRWNDLVVRSEALGFSDYNHNLKNERSGYPVMVNAGPSRDPLGSQYFGLGPVDITTATNTPGLMPYLPTGASPHWSGHEDTYGPLIDASHMPNLYPIAYLRTGHRCYLDGMQTLAASLMVAQGPGGRNFTVGTKKYYSLPSSNLGGQLRGMAWQLKAVGQAEFVTPDNDLLKPALSDTMYDTADFHIKYFPNYVNPPQVAALGGICFDNTSTAQNLYQYNFLALAIGMEAWRDADDLVRPGWKEFLTTYASRAIIKLYDADAGGGFFRGPDGGLNAYSGNVFFGPNSTTDRTLAFQTPAELWADPQNGALPFPQPAGFSSGGYVDLAYPFDAIRYHTNWAAALAMWSWLGIPKAKIMWQRWYDASHTAPYTGILWAQNGTNGHYDLNTPQSYVPWAVAPAP